MSTSTEMEVHHFHERDSFYRTQSSLDIYNVVLEGGRDKHFRHVMTILNEREEFKLMRSLLANNKR